MSIISKINGLINNYEKCVTQAERPGNLADLQTNLAKIKELEDSLIHLLPFVDADEIDLSFPSKLSSLRERTENVRNRFLPSDSKPTPSEEKKGKERAPETPILKNVVVKSKPEEKGKEKTPQIPSGLLEITSLKNDKEVEESFTHIFLPQGKDRSAPVYPEITLLENGTELKREKGVAIIQISLGNDWNNKASFEDLLESGYFIDKEVWSYNQKICHERKFNKEPEVLIFQVKRFRTQTSSELPEIRIDGLSKPILFHPSCNCEPLQACLNTNKNEVTFYKIPANQPIYLVKTNNGAYLFNKNGLEPLAKEKFDDYLKNPTVSEKKGTLLSSSAKTIRISDPIPSLKPDFQIQGKHILGNKDADYEVVSFIEDVGGLNSGHYMAYIKIGGSWFQIKDRKPQPVGQREAEQALQRSYLICAQKKIAAQPLVLDTPKKNEAISIHSPSKPVIELLAEQDRQKDLLIQPYNQQTTAAISEDNYICPITGEIMEDPVTTPEGLTYEKTAIETWLNQGETLDPMTKKPLKITDLKPNPKLKAKIEVYNEAWKATIQEAEINNSQVVFLQLPDELIVKCLSYLTPLDLLTTALVCKRLRTISCDASLLNPVVRANGMTTVQFMDRLYVQITCSLFEISLEDLQKKTLETQKQRNAIQFEEDFICLFSLYAGNRTIMEDPVITPEGITYERKNITKWINDGNQTPPLSSSPPRITELKPNTNLKAKIDAYKAQQNNSGTVVVTFAQQKQQLITLLKGKPDTYILALEKKAPAAILNFLRKNDIKPSLDSLIKAIRDGASPYVLKKFVEEGALNQERLLFFLSENRYKPENTVEECLQLIELGASFIDADLLNRAISDPHYKPVFVAKMLSSASTETIKIFTTRFLKEAKLDECLRNPSCPIDLKLRLIEIKASEINHSMIEFVVQDYRNFDSDIIIKLIDSTHVKIKFDLISLAFIFLNGNAHKAKIIDKLIDHCETPDFDYLSVSLTHALINHYPPTTLQKLLKLAKKTKDDIHLSAIFGMTSMMSKLDVVDQLVAAGYRITSKIVKDAKILKWPKDVRKRLKEAYAERKY